MKSSKNPYKDTTSIWCKEISFPAFDALKNDMNVEAAVIGGGMCGLLTAWRLKQNGISVAVFEADTIASGQTGHTTAKVTSQHGLIYRHIADKMSEEKAVAYASANEWAVGEYERIILENNIDCDWKRLPAYLYTNNNVEVLAAEWDAAKKAGIHAVFYTEFSQNHQEQIQQKKIPAFPMKAALAFPDQAEFHPLKFLQGIIHDLDIYEHTRVIKVEENKLYTKDACVTAEHIIFATHYPFINKPGYYFMRMHQERDYALALEAHESSQALEGVYYGIDSGDLSLRSCKGHLIVTGGNHRCGENSKGGRFMQLAQQAKAYWPDARISEQWSAQDCVTLDMVPYIGQFSEKTENWYVATGFRAWGMSTSMVASKIICDRIVRNENPWAFLYSPDRIQFSASAITMMEDSMKSVKGLAREFLVPAEIDITSLPEGHGGIVTCEGEKFGAYHAPDGRFYLVSSRCQHLNCQVEWNPDELSWDCPCHGSRFSYDGSLIDNPAQMPLPAKEAGK